MTSAGRTDSQLHAGACGADALQHLSIATLMLDYRYRCQVKDGYVVLHLECSQYILSNTRTDAVLMMMAPTGVCCTCTHPPPFFVSLHPNHRRLPKNQLMLASPEIPIFPVG